MYERVLVSLDGTPDAETALPEVEKLLRMQPLPATVILLRVGPPIDIAAAMDEMKRGAIPGATSGVPDVPNDEYALLNNAAELEIRAYLDKLGARLQQLGATVVTEVSFRNPAVEILYLADYYKSDLIVMATHGRRGLNRLLHGSVTEMVMESTPCPMLIVRVPVSENAIHASLAYSNGH